ncbi:MAG: sugar ABC transporter ATP-binding protein [Planctomycetota bacterium]|nr:sugar ABC transporter ATP-binding protein [Planctomycetota bacterium]
MGSIPLLGMKGVGKSFGGTRALDDVSFDVHAGEIHSIVGENGAGKSTLMKMIAGVHAPDSGHMEMDGKPVVFHGPADATRAGVSIVYQEPMFFPKLSVVENFYLGEELLTPSGGMDWRRMTEEAAEGMTRMGLSPDIVSKSMNELSIGTQQLTLIARGVHRNARLLLLDEPTSILSHVETGILFSMVRELKRRGVGILYISHRIQELFQIADAMTVLRDGRKIVTMPVAEATEASLVEAMSGRSVEFDNYVKRDIAGDPMLSVKDLSRAGYYSHVAFTLRKGEILGVYGLVGAGRSEMARAIFGEMPADSGSIELDGKPFAPASVKAAFDSGIAYVPEDRRIQGLFMSRAIRDNMTAGLLPRLASGRGVIDRKREREVATRTSERLNVKSAGIEAPASSLSGGNQQKVLLSRGILHEPRVLILDEPTRGIDVRTKSEVHRLIMELAGQGVSILLISSDLPEVLGLADSFVVMHEGRMSKKRSREEAGEQEILRLALGLEPEKV